MKVVQEMLGHSTLAFTADVHTSVLPEIAFAAAEAAARMVLPAASGTDWHTRGRCASHA